MLFFYAETCSEMDFCYDKLKVVCDDAENHLSPVIFKHAHHSR